ncbi:MAG: phosphate/phosphite/phosphonate ABC transporter substrate-binding protein [Chloroflexi bacterium]|nr:phosphate/phosphite/phosphonate ABC transporter substrate-binding protein [Chloroflexota bacterium]
MLRSFRGPIAIAMAAGVLFAACGGAGGTAQPSATTAASAAPSAPRLGGINRPIQLAITPSGDVQSYTASGNAIASALGQATGLAWKVSVPTSYAAQIEAMCSGQTDVGFIAPLQMTLLLDKKCGTPVLAALRKDETGKLAPTYNSQILVRSDSGINDVNGLKGKKFAFVSSLSASGYLFPALTVKKASNQDPKTFFASTIFAGGHPQAALAVYNGQVDGASTFVDVRVTTPGGTTITSGMPADILTKTKVISTAGPIPNDGIAFRANFPADIAAQVKKALLDYAASDAGKKTLGDPKFIGWDGIQEVTATFYDDMKAAATLAGIDVAAEAAKTPTPVTPAPTKAP